MGESGELGGRAGRSFGGIGWSIVVSAFPGLSSGSCSNANLFGDSLIHGFMCTGKVGRETEGESEDMKSITCESFSTVDWSSLRVFSKTGTLEASNCRILISLARSRTRGFVDLQSSRQLGHNH